MTFIRVQSLLRVAAPVAAVVFLTLWLLAESGRDNIVERAIGYGCYALLLGLSAWVPRLALIGIAVVPLAQLFGILARPESTDWPVYLAVPLVLAIVALQDERRFRLLALVAGVVSAVSFAAAVALPHGHSPFPWLRSQVVDYGWLSWTGAVTNEGTFVTHGEPVSEGYWAVALLAIAGATLLALAGGWGIGAAIHYAFRARESQAFLVESERALAESETSRQLVEQREQIAADVHDVLAHSLTVIIAQADGAVASGAQHPTFQRVGDIARESLADVRALIERLDSGEPAAATLGLENLEDLIERFRTVGMRVDLLEVGDRPEIADGMQLTVYRILQEALTNALKHGGRESQVGIGLDWRGNELVIRVVSKPCLRQGDSEASEASTGVGLTVMRERARMAGGWLSAGPDEGEFIVSAVLPQRVVNETVLR